MHGWVRPCWQQRQQQRLSHYAQLFIESTRRQLGSRSHFDSHVAVLNTTRHSVAFNTYAWQQAHCLMRWCTAWCCQFEFTCCIVFTCRR
jgi:hypothetical protein